jgi:hypothetical protein
MLADDPECALELSGIGIILVGVSGVKDVHELVYEVDAVIHRETSRPMLVLARQ